MISTLSSYDDEPLNSAYANISLIADKAWAFDKEDVFHKLNQSLWIQNYKITAKYEENHSRGRKRVHDVIPDSLLAKYGNYEYDDERERTYAPVESNTISRGNFHWTEITEPWMLPEVEERFAWLISKAGRPSHEYSSTRGQETEGKFRRTESSFRPSWNDPPHKCASQKPVPSEKRRADANYKAECHEKFDDHENCYEQYHRRYSIENPAEMQLHIRVTGEDVRSLWDPAKNQRQFEQSHLQCHRQQRYFERPEVNSQRRDRQQQLYCTLQYQPLILRTEYQSKRTESYGIARKPLTPMLSPEVSEFFPKVPASRFNVAKEYNANRVQYFPSLNERSYQNELFPYNKHHEHFGTVYQNMGMPMLQAPDSSAFVRAPDSSAFVRAPQQWFQRVPAPTQMQMAAPSANPMCPSMQALRAATITHHPPQVREKFVPSMQPSATPIPVYQRPIELYPESTQKRKNQGVDFKNLILLTKNAMKTHRGQAKDPQQKSGYALEHRNRSSKREVLRWLDKGSTLKAKEFVAVNTFVSELRSFEGKLERGRVPGQWKDVDESTKAAERVTSEGRVDDSNLKTSNETEETDTRTRRRLYRDVLANVSANMIPESVFDKRYDELEQQAMEQYRNSEESLALKYQELERQAMEQYKYCSGAQEVSTSTNVAGSTKETYESSAIFKERNCHDGRKCSGFGGCAPVNQEEGTKKGSFLQPQITLLKPENRVETKVPDRSSTNKDTRPTIASKSLTTLTKKMSYRSKNTSKGASGDEIDERVRASSERRLILMSPFERKSEARLRRTTDLEEFYCVSHANKDIFRYYDDPRIRNPGGGGDENITIIRSPRAEVWLSGFWTT